MTGGITVVAGLPIPSTSPLFLAGVAIHVVFGIGAVAAGAVAMLARKGPGRHPFWGRTYVWALTGLAATSGALAAARWAQDAPLFALGVLALGCALAGRWARRRRRAGWKAPHIVGMGLSYVLMLTAFYVDNGRNLPLWRALPTLAFWIGPALVGLPIVAVAVRRHARRGGGAR